MPPKKKGKKGAKDPKKKGGKEGDLNDGDKLKMKTHEVDALKDTLAFRKDFSRRSKAAFEDLKEKLEETNNQIEEISSVHKASSAYLTHQYKNLQVCSYLFNQLIYIYDLKSMVIWFRVKLQN